MTLENPHAGQGAVMLDIGDDVGALVVEMPREMLGVEIEIRPLGADDHPQHDHDHDHDHGHGHDHPHEGGHDHGQGHHPHVAVVDRPTPVGSLPSLVYGALIEGTYELYEKGGGPVMLTATVRGGEVSQVVWPD